MLMSRTVASNAVDPVGRGRHAAPCRVLSDLQGTVGDTSYVAAANETSFQYCRDALLASLFHA